MKANELRIGNLVKNNEPRYGDKILVIESIGDNDTVNVFFREYPINALEGIQLTEEWLFKFGLQSNKWFCENSFCFVEDKTGDTHYGWCIKVQNASHTKEIEFGYFKYVHQLQNLYFALTGEELTFKSE